MDGENNGKPYEQIEQMDDLGGPPLFLETPISHDHLKIQWL